MEIKIHCYSDQKLEGVVRICEIDIEGTETNSNDAINNKIFKVLGQKEYFSSEENWKEEVVNDIIGCIDCTDEIIDIIVN